MSEVRIPTTPALSDARNPNGRCPDPRKPEKTATAGVRTEHGTVSCRCGATWTGLGRAHCAACHRTFSTANLFDQHRSSAGDRGSCHDPATITTANGERAVFFRDGMWRGPELTDEQKTALFGERGGDSR